MSNRAWHSRPSLISCWEHESSLIDLTGAPINDLNSLWISSPFSLPYPVPRACRITRVAIFFSFLSVLGGGLLFFEIDRSTDCGGSWVLQDSEEIDQGPGGLVEGGCTCYSVSIPYDSCDLWRIRITNLSGNDYTFPNARATLHFELR